MPLPEGKWLSADPGEDFGWALWQGHEFLTHGTNKMWDVSDALQVAALRELGCVDALPVVMATETEDELSELFTGISLIVAENWRLYPWAVQQGRLDWDECRTARVIGSMYALCRLTGWTWETQPAKIKEAAVAAGAEAYFSHPLNENRHQNDATMHGVYRIAKDLGAKGIDLSEAKFDLADTEVPH